MPDPTWRRRSSSSVISRSSSFVSGHVLLTEYLHEESPLVRVTSTAVVQSQACPHVGLVFLEYGVKPIVLNDPIHRTNKRKKGGRLHTCLDELLRQAQDSSSSTHHAKQTNKQSPRSNSSAAPVFGPLKLSINDHRSRFARTRNRR